MDQPTIAARRPIAVQLQPGSYHWCACGRSKTQPFCDGSHAGTSFSPVAFELSEAKTVVLCACKHTHNQPFCDGAHKNLPQA